ncbi:hypothetical protein DL96DRAFT_1822162 [Flagelloscypha sp. PMI_526]|nr:hypothetical protein DL96DRAFT_1822162 [Flagelloscypha sp. PMI_526]
MALAMTKCRDTDGLSQMINKALDTSHADLFLASPKSDSLAHIYRTFLDNTPQDAVQKLPQDHSTILKLQFQVATESRAAQIEHSAQLKIAIHFLEADLKALQQRNVQEAAMAVQIHKRHANWRKALEDRYHFDVVAALHLFDDEGYDKRETLPRIIHALTYYRNKNPTFLKSYNKVIDEIRANWLEELEDESDAVVEECI